MMHLCQFRTLLYASLILFAFVLASAQENWAIIVCSSKYWFNYRHLTNALVVYKILKKNGMNDDRIIFMNSLSEIPCDSRNSRSTQVLDENKDYYANVSVDYFGHDVNVANFLQLLTGRHHNHLPNSKRLLTNENSRILIFLSGHGGDEFFKFNDQEEMSAQDLGFAFKEMEIKKRYKEILLIIETCQAATLSNFITSPSIITIGSSAKGENSYSYHSDATLGVSTIDRFAYATKRFFDSNFFSVGQPTILPPDSLTSAKGKATAKAASVTLGQFVDALDPRFLHSKPTVISSPMSRNFRDVLLLDFFGPGQGQRDRSPETHWYQVDAEMFRAGSTDFANNSQVDSFLGGAWTEEEAIIFALNNLLD